MNTHHFTGFDAKESMDCFADFDKTNPLCTKYCAIRLRCAIEQNNNLRIEILEELMASEESQVKIQ
jgi:hypothetical protein